MCKLGHLPYSIVFDKDVLPAFQEIWKETDWDIIGLMHDDLLVHEYGWDVRVLEEFADPKVGMVGFSGALGHGTPNLYTSPYHLPNLARQNFMSNLRDAEKHGARFKGARDVSVLDGMALFIRRPILDKVGGWPLEKPIGYWLYSEHQCCEARRQGYRIRLVGVDCSHLGGKSSGFISPLISYEDAHKYFWETHRDCLPYRVSDVNSGHENSSGNAPKRLFNG
jgi:hypothetical protein